MISNYNFEGIINGFILDETLIDCNNVICDVNSQILTISKKMYNKLGYNKSIKELDQFNLLFTLDEDVIRGNGIDKLYSCKYNAKTKGVTYTTTSLKLFDKKKPATE